MPRYAVIEQSTDLRARGTKIRFTNSKTKALSYLKGSGRYTYGDPNFAQNWHRTFVEVYELPDGWRKPSKKKLEEEAMRWSTSTYPRTVNDVLAYVISSEGIEVKL